MKDIPLREDRRFLSEDGEGGRDERDQHPPRRERAGVSAALIEPDFLPGRFWL